MSALLGYNPQFSMEETPTAAEAETVASEPTEAPVPAESQEVASKSEPQQVETAPEVAEPVTAVEVPEPSEETTEVVAEAAVVAEAIEEETVAAPAAAAAAPVKQVAAQQPRSQAQPRAAVVAEAIEEETVAAPAAAAAPVKQVAAQQPRSQAQPRRNRKKIEREQEPKADTIAKLRKHDKDVGSSEIQIGLLTERILHLTEHLKLHTKDKHTNYGLLKLVSKRKGLLKYLERSNPDSFRELKSTLNLR